jgi:hypothetical protein
MGIGGMTHCLQPQDDLISADSPNDESQEMRWVRVDEVTLLTLHPSFAKTWSDLRQVLDNLVAPI